MLKDLGSAMQDKGPWSWLSLRLEFILKGLGMQIQTLSYKVGWLDRLMDNEPAVITIFAVG
jgi:hypothetical protein